MSSLAIITARGGSKRIPRKNIKNFCGHPIIKYSIDAATLSKCFDEVMVSTDDEEIASIAKSHGAKIPFMRSEKNSDDYSTTADVMIEVIEQYKKMGQDYKYVCCIYPTAPFVTSKKITNAMDILKNEQCESVIPVVKYGYPIQRSLKILKDNRLAMNWPENYLKRSQDLEEAYHDCGQFYCVKVSEFLKSKKLFSKNTIPIITSEIESQDIDSNEDWAIAELKYELCKKYNS